MDWLQFLASLVGSFAWPVTIFALVIVLREPVIKALLTLSKIKYKDFELTFSHDMEQIREQAKVIDVELIPPKSFPLNDEKVKNILDGAERLAYEYPEAAIAMGWQAVEHELAVATVKRSITQEYPRRNSAKKNADLLLRDEAIDERTNDLLNSMSNLRNKVVHSRHSSEKVTTDEAVEFISLSRSMVVRLQMLPHK